MPDGWVEIHIDDFSDHMSYPALVSEINQVLLFIRFDTNFCMLYLLCLKGYISFYGKLPSDEHKSILFDLGNGQKEIKVTVKKSCVLNCCSGCFAD